MGSTGKAVENRELRTDISKRQLKLHVTTELKKAGLNKAETYSTAIRGYRSTSRPGYEWGPEYGGVLEPHIEFIGGWKGTGQKEYLDRVEQVLSKNFKTERGLSSVTILGEYKKK